MISANIRIIITLHYLYFSILNILFIDFVLRVGYSAITNNKECSIGGIYRCRMKVDRKVILKLT